MKVQTKLNLSLFIVVLLAAFFVITSNHFWPQTYISMNIDKFPYCFYFDDKKEITCYNKAVTTKYVKDAYHIVFEKANTFNEKGE